MSLRNIRTSCFHLTAIIGLALQSQFCLAHNSGVVVQSNGGKLVTGFIDEVSQEHAIVQRAIPQLMPTGLADDFPGFLSQGNPVGGNDPLTVGKNLHWDFLPMNSSGGRSNLLYWDGIGSTVGDVDFGDVPSGDVTFSLFDENLVTSSVAHGTDELVEGTYIGNVTTNATTPLHAHLWSFIGSATSVPEGIYLVAMRLRMDGYENSAALYMAAATPSISESTLNDLALPWVENRLDTLVIPGDFDFDGKVDGLDLLQWQSHQSVGNLADWQASYGTHATSALSQTIPEPSTFILLGVAILLQPRRYR